jgi:hypothetical protein
MLLKVAELPRGAQQQPPKGRIILAWGEVTGHAHAVPMEHAVLYKHQEDSYLNVLQPTGLTHEEHSRIDLQPGVYKVVLQREYTPERTRLVAD